MISYKLDIKSNSNPDFVLQKQEEYSYAFRKLYRNFHLKENQEFICDIYNLSVLEWRSLLQQAEMKVSQTETNKKKLEDEILDLIESSNKLKLKEKRTRKETKKLFKSNKKLSKKEKSLGNDIVFGSRKLLKEITHLNNKYYNSETEQERLNIKQILDSKKEEFKENRILPLYIIGECGRCGNRLFDFDLPNKLIIYKPKKGVEVELRFSDYKTKKKDLLKLQEMIDSKSIAVSVFLSNDSISLSFDDTKINNFDINEKERRVEVNKVKDLGLDKETTTDLIRQVYIKYYDELKSRKLVNKIETRCMGIDLNPEHIGISVLESNQDGTFKIIHLRDFDLSNLCAKLPREATQGERTHQNNKRKHTICHVWKKIFQIFKYYKCSYLHIEDLNFKSKSRDLEVREANRKVNNVWHRELSKNLIDKYCNREGILRHKNDVNPVYTSLIGNLSYGYFDPVNASIEIGRRGIYCYTKGNFYPRLEVDTIMNTMSRINCVDLRDVSFIKDCKSWKEIGGAIKESGLRYRARMDESPFIVCKPFQGVENVSFHILS